LPSSRERSVQEVCMERAGISATADIFCRASLGICAWLCMALAARGGK
jgi:hypothetical protein